MNIKIVSTETEFAHLKDEWTSLLDLSENQSPFLTWQWMFMWWKKYSDKMHPLPQLRIIKTTDDQNNLISIWPLFISVVYSTIGKLRIAKFIGTSFESSDYLDIIASPQMDTNHFDAILNSNVFNDIVKSVDKIVLKNVLEDSFIYKHKDQLRYLKWQRRIAICPYLSLPQDKDELLNSLSKNMKSGLRRTYNKLKNDPDIAIRTVLEKNDINLSIENLFKLHEARFNDQDKDTKFVFSQRGVFHQEISKTFLDKNWLRFYEVKYKGEVIGSLYCYLFGKTLMYYQAGFNPEFSQYALGNQLILHAINDAISLNCSEFDFMRGDEAYKYKWTTTERYLYTIEFGCSQKGKLQIAKKTISKSIKKKLNKVIKR
jgi:CelD/BcsL family acetyltransferase involved in cellulose biosynthesis